MPLEREWVTIVDPDHDEVHYTFDVSFLLSSYTCIYGAGCQGIRTDRVDTNVGCCAHGAYLDEDHAGEAEMLEDLLERLGPTTMRHHDTAVADGLFEDDEDGETHTRVVEDGCLFLNPPGFPAGEGCALHHLAARDDAHHMTYKPTVCWQLPLHRTIEEAVGNDGGELTIHTIAAFERGKWGEGGADFDWWCTEDPDAFVASEPVYRSMEYELRAMVGAAVYDELAGYLGRRGRQRNQVRFLPLVT